MKWKRPLLSFSRLTSVPRITLSSRCLPDFFFFNYFLWRPFPLPLLLFLQPLLLEKSCDQVSFPVVGTVITNWDSQHQRPKRSELSRIRMAKFKAQKLSRLSENCPCYPETFQVIRKIPRPSQNFPEYPETFQTIRKLSRPYRNFPVQFQGFRAKTFWTRKNFPDGNATMPRRFLCLCNSQSRINKVY